MTVADLTLHLQQDLLPQDPPARLTPAEAACWRELVAACRAPLRRSDSLFVEYAARVLSSARTAPITRRSSLAQRLAANLARMPIGDAERSRLLSTTAPGATT